LVFSSNLFAAERVTLQDGRTGIFFEDSAAKKLLDIVDIEYPRLKNENELMLEQITHYKQLIELQDQKFKNEEEMSKKWKENYIEISKQIANQNETERFDAYMDIVIFSCGALIGGTIMYVSSLLIANTIK